MPTPSKRPGTSLGLRQTVAPEKSVNYDVQRPASTMGMRSSTSREAGSRPQSRHSMSGTDRPARPRTAFTVSSTASDRKPACQYISRSSNASSYGSASSTSSSYTSKVIDCLKDCSALSHLALQTSRSITSSASKTPARVAPPTLLDHNTSKRAKRKTKVHETIFRGLGWRQLAKLCLRAASCVWHIQLGVRQHHHLSVHNHNVMQPLTHHNLTTTCFWGN